MIVYDKNKLRETFFLSDVRYLKDSGFVTKEHWQLASDKTSGLYTHRNWFFRMLFGILGLLLYLAVIGAVSLVFLSIIDRDFKIVLVFYALVVVAVTEVIARLGCFRYGLDDIGVLFNHAAVGGVVYAYTENTNAVYLVLIVLSVLTLLRYVHSLSVVVFIGALLWLLSDFALNSGTISGFTLPFLLAALAGILLFSRRFLSRWNIHGFYTDAISTYRSSALILLYLSLNYALVRFAAAALMQVVVLPGEDLPFGWIFRLLTFIIPMVYIAIGIWKKDRPILWIGMASFAVSVYSVRLFYYILPGEWEFLIGGLLLFALSFYAYRKLRGREKGLTYEPDRFERTPAFQVAEMVIANANTHVSAPESSPMEFGGGDFSGGGSSSGY